MDGESSLERYLDQCEAQDGLHSTPQMYTPMTPYDDLNIQPISGTSYRSDQEQSKDLSADLDLSFLPDDLNPEHEEKDNLTELQDSGIGLDSSGLSHPYTPCENRDASSLRPMPITPMTPMTPMTPVAESSGIIPQLQYVLCPGGLCEMQSQMMGSNIIKSLSVPAGEIQWLKQMTTQHFVNLEFLIGIMHVDRIRFAAVIMRIREPRTTALIFSSGKMVCTGAKSEEQSRLAARKYARVVQKLGFPAKFLDFKIQNMVGSCDVTFPIRLEGLVLTHQQFSSYEPELFPGLIYRMVKPRIVLLIFVSGKVVLTGAKERSEIYEAFENIYPILRSFKKT